MGCLQLRIVFKDFNQTLKDDSCDKKKQFYQIQLYKQSITIKFVQFILNMYEFNKNFFHKKLQILLEFWLLRRLDTTIYASISMIDQV